MNHEKYIGIPYKKANCADLALMIQKEEFGKEYNEYIAPGERDAIFFFFGD